MVKGWKKAFSDNFGYIFTNVEINSHVSINLFSLLLMFSFVDLRLEAHVVITLRTIYISKCTIYKLYIQYIHTYVTVAFIFWYSKSQRNIFSSLYLFTMVLKRKINNYAIKFSIKYHNCCIGLKYII